MSFQSAVSDFLTKFKAAKARLPAADQFEVNSMFRWSLTSILELAEDADALFTTEMASAFAEAEKNSKTAGITEGRTEAMAEVARTHILITDHAAAVQAAADTAAKDTRTAVEAEMTTRIMAQAERTKLITDSKIPAMVAEKIADGALTAANAEATRTKITERVARLTALNATPEKHGNLFAACAEAGFEDGSDAKFEASIKAFEDGVSAGREAAKTGANAEAATGKGRNPMFPEAQSKPAETEKPRLSF